VQLSPHLSVAPSLASMHGAFGGSGGGRAGGGDGRGGGDEGGDCQWPSRRPSSSEPLGPAIAGIEGAAVTRSPTAALADSSLCPKASVIFLGACPPILAAGDCWASTVGSHRPPITTMPLAEANVPSLPALVARPTAKLCMRIGMPRTPAIVRTLRTSAAETRSRMPVCIHRPHVVCCSGRDGDADGGGDKGGVGGDLGLSGGGSVGGGGGGEGSGGGDGKSGAREGGGMPYSTCAQLRQLSCRLVCPSTPKSVEVDKHELLAARAAANVWSALPLSSAIGAFITSPSTPST
jgi:hypothetical protein